MPIPPLVLAAVAAFLLVGRRTRIDPALAALVSGAALVRFWRWSAAGLDHFDAGAYAISAQAVAAGLFPAAGYPTQHLMSPPFHFGSVGAAMMVIGDSDAAVLGMSALFGVATVALTWAFTRAAFGRTSAIMACGFIAFADVHVLYARSGLADVTFVFWLLLALHLFADAERRSSRGWAAAAGFAVGFAWTTKVHGWLALVVVGAALALRVGRGERADVRPALGRLAIAGAVAGLMYVPWAVFASGRPGGAEQLVGQYGEYLRPLEFVSHVTAHVRAQLLMDGWMGRVGAALVAGWLAVTASPADRTRAAGRAVGVGGLALALGPVLLALLASLPGALAILRSERDPRRDSALALLALFAVLTPVYHPYPRLALPLLVASQIVGGAAIASWIRGAGPAVELRLPNAGPIAKSAPAVIVAVVLVATLQARPVWTAADTFRPTAEFRAAAEAVAAAIPPGSTTLVWAEPPVAFYLRGLATGVFPIHDPREIERYAALGRPLYLVTSLYAERVSGSANPLDRIDRSLGVLEPLSVVPVDGVSDIRIVNDWRTADLATLRARDFAGDFDGYDVRVFRILRP